MRHTAAVRGVCEHTFVKRLERIKAERLRREDGLSIKAIASRVGVSPGTASRWLRDVPLTPAQRDALAAQNPVLNGQHLGAKRLADRARAVRRSAQDHGRRLAERGDPLHQAGCMLYWAEGSKDRNKVIFTNSDLDMVRMFLRFLRQCYGVEDRSVTLSLNVHLGNGASLSEIESWWLEHLGLPGSCLRKAAVNRTSRSSLGRRPPLVYGTARLAVGSTFVVQSIYGAIQAYAGFERPAWLA
jgi:transcriptional regulator with XRE-family HTH domain